jgi:hypothetical protein
MIRFSNYIKENNELTTRYHGSPNKFDKFNTKDIFLAKDKAEAMRYGNYIYEITYKGKPKFKTNTIEVITPAQIESMKIIEHNKNQKIYRT